ncbi:VQ motif-containing protein 9-like [Euphorbia lathyris]|uniref:VQ motif-containing protein 9-like n=1 Tax=Euphorbia lathyris TaxID=212925 RepID=UPI0033130BF1
MDKTYQSSVDSTITTRNHYLKNLNKLSHKISKPNISTSNNSHILNNNLNQSQSLVYHINKNDFRDVVQKLTGSPAHQSFSAPPLIHPPKPSHSGLEHIRPPPLGDITHIPLPSSNASPHPLPPPLSPLPPFPLVHAAAESPVSAYMHDLHNSNSIPTAYWGFSHMVPLDSPARNNLTLEPASAMMTSQPQSPLILKADTNFINSDIPPDSSVTSIISPDDDETQQINNLLSAPPSDFIFTNHQNSNFDSSNFSNFGGIQSNQNVHMMMPCHDVELPPLPPDMIIGFGMSLSFWGINLGRI